VVEPERFDDIDLTANGTGGASDANEELKRAADGAREAAVVQADEEPRGDGGPVSADPPASQVPPVARDALFAEILSMEQRLVLKDGMLAKSRQEGAGDADLDNCDNVALGQYRSSLCGDLEKRAARRKK